MICPAQNRHTVPRKQMVRSRCSPCLRAVPETARSALHKTSGYQRPAGDLVVKTRGLENKCTLELHRIQLRYLASKSSGPILIPRDIRCCNIIYNQKGPKIRRKTMRRGHPTSHPRSLRVERCSPVGLPLLKGEWGSEYRYHY